MIKITPISVVPLNIPNNGLNDPIILHLLESPLLLFQQGVTITLSQQLTSLSIAFIHVPVTALAGETA